MYIHVHNIIYIYIPKSPKAVLWRSLPNVAQKRIIAEKIIATAEVLRPRGYSNVHLAIHSRLLTIYSRF